MARPLGNIQEIISHIQTLNLPDLYVTQIFETYIRPYIKRKTLLGEGGAASAVYPLDIPKQPKMFVIKQTSPCNVDDASDALGRYCQQIKDEKNSIFNIPNSDKNIIELPNYIMEAIIGGYLHLLSKNKYSFHFASIYGLWVDPIEQRAYTLMRRYNVGIENIIKNKNDIYIILFQVSHALSVAQEVYRYTHYDLHGENLLYEEIDPNQIKTLQYPIVSINNKSDINDEDSLDNKSILKIRQLYVKNNGYLTKISDQGLARMESGDVIINSRVDDYPIRTEGQFNQSYDIVCILHYLLMKKSKLINLVSQKVQQTGITDEERAELYDIVFDVGENINKENLDEFIKETYMNKWWRPLDGKLIRYLQTKDLHKITYKLANILIERKLATYYNKNESPDREVKNKITISPSSVILKTERLDEYNLLFPWRVSGPYKGEYSPPSQGSLKSPTLQIYQVAPGIKILSDVFRYQEGINPWEWTPTKKEKESCSNDKNIENKLQYIHHVYIDLDKAQKAGYEFRLDCCKLDPLNYMKDRVGVTINGSFFDVVPDGTSKPIGPYKMTRPTKNMNNNENNDTFMSNLPLPKQYRKYYRYLNIKNGKLSIDKQPDFLADHYLASGPVLVENGKIVVSGDLLNSNFPIQDPTLLPIKMFQCSIPKNEDEKQQVLLGPDNLKKSIQDFGDIRHSCANFSHDTDKYVFNCEKINPGELSHASNPNPRSMLVLRDNIDGQGDVILVYIEGRDDRGMGVDLQFLASYAKDVLMAHTALNLDGGRSSAIAWRTDKYDTVKTANILHKDFYTVGNLISLVKK